MDQLTKRAREIQRQIGAVLHRNEDPIGIKDEPAVADKEDK